MSTSGSAHVCAGPREKYWESMLQRQLSSAVVLDQCPRSCIQVVIQVCQQGGSELAVVLNAAIAALLDAAVPMHAMFAAASVAVTEQAMLVDPGSQEEQVLQLLPFT